MAKNRGKSRTKESPAAVAEPPETVRPQKQRPAGALREKRFAGLFKMYKPGQGKQLRLWTGVGSGVLILGAANWFFTKFKVYFGEERLWLAAALTAGLVGLLALAVWYLVGVRPGSVDFLIATESEMKKVTWSSRQEVWGATKVVIAMVILVAVGLFAVDAMFASFFAKIGVLRLGL